MGFGGSSCRIWLGGRLAKLAFDFAGTLSQNLIRVVLYLENPLFRLLVLTQAQEDWMAHASISRPFRELNLSYELWLYPLNRFVGFRFLNKGAVPGFKRLHQLMSLGQCLMIKTAPGVGDIMEFAVAVEANYECSEIFA